MTTILFVDNDDSVLNHFSGWCKQNRPNWKTLTATGVETAIQLANTAEVDCVVSDLTLPDQSGVDLFRHMTQKKPEAILIGFSAEPDAELRLESLQVTNRFVSKPAKTEVICDAIERSLTLHRQLNDSQLRSLVASMPTLPVLPEIYDRLMLELASENFSIDNIGRIIESDISLTATLLRVVNSSYYSMVTHVQSPTHAVKLLGVELIKNILLTDNITSQIKQLNADVVRINELNSQACIRGILANRFSRLAKLEKRQIDHCQMAAMLSTLGQLILELNMNIPKSEQEPPHDPDLLGSCILGLWSLPDAIVEAVLHQNNSGLPGCDITAMHVLRVIRLLENTEQLDVNLLEETITQTSVFKELQIDDALARQWANCFSEYHTELKFAA